MKVPGGKEVGREVKTPRQMVALGDALPPKEVGETDFTPTIAPWLAHRHSMLWHPPPPPGITVPSQGPLYTLPPATQTLTQATETSSRVCTPAEAEQGQAW